MHTSKPYAGTHLLVDAFTSMDKNMLMDVAFIHRVIASLIDTIGMKPIGVPTWYRVGLKPEFLERDDDEGGVSYIQMLSTSHVSLHVWPLRGRFSLDVFSCKPYDTDAAAEYLRQWFEITVMTCSVVERLWPILGDSDGIRDQM